MIRADATTPRVSFNAKATLRQSVSAPAHLQFDQVLYNQGNAFDNNTGDFTAPVAGTYVFIFHTESYLNVGAHSYIMANGTEICRTDVYDSDGYELGSCSAVVHLSVGERVWVEPLGGPRYYYGQTTSFIGFLISDDPQ